MIEYQWREGSQVAIDAQVAGTELERIREQEGGGFTPEAVVRAARRRSSPLHPVFEWDDSKAAAAHRLDQARYLTRSIAYRVIDDEARPPIRAFVTVRTDHGAAYVDTRSALGNDDMREQMRVRALSELESWQRRYGELEEFAEVTGAIFAVREELRVA